MQELVIIKAYHSRLEAEIDQQRLKDVGIISLIKADDAGGMYPTLAHSLGVQLYTNLEHATQADRIINPTQTKSLPGDDLK